MIQILSMSVLVAQLMTCVGNASVRLAATSQQPTDVIIEAAYGECAHEKAKVDQELGVGSLGAARAGAIGQMVLDAQQRDRQIVDDEVFAYAFKRVEESRHPK